MARGSVPSLDELVKAAVPPVERRKARLGKRLVPYALSSPAAVWLGIFFLIPVGYMAFVSLESGGLISGFRFTWHFTNYLDGMRLYSTQFIRSLEYAGAVTVLALLITYPMAYWIAFYGGKRKSTYLFLILLPFFVSFIIRTVQWQFMLADQGIILGPLKHLGLLRDDFHVLATPLAVVAGITYNFLPFTALPLYVSLERIDKALVEAGKDLYANKVTTFLKVVWPLSIPGVFAAFLLTFVPAVGDYINAELLGGPATRMIGNVIQTAFLDTYYPLASAMAFVLMAILLVGASIYARVLGTEEVTAGAVAT